MKQADMKRYLIQRLKRVRFCCKRLGMRLDHAGSKRADAVVFAAFSGKKYADNPRFISEALHEIVPGIQIYWLFHAPEQKKALLPDYVKTGVWKSRAADALLARAKVWVFNDPAPAQLYRGADQLYIETWHGDRGFKKILFDSENVNPASEDPLIEKDIASLMLAGSDRGEKKLRSAFRYGGEILKCGCPRNDLLVRGDEGECARIRESLGVSPDEGLLLYAPTLRRDAFSRHGAQDVSGVDLIACLERLCAVTNKTWRCLVRAHSGVGGLAGVQKDERILDVTAYEDMADLLLVADVLLTDYSSSAGDFALTGRPVVLYQPDRAEYVKNDRSFYFDPDETPFWIAKTQAELLERLGNLSGAKENDQEILAFYGACESGGASKAAAERILRFIREGK